MSTSSKLNWTYESIPGDEDRVLDYMGRLSTDRSYRRKLLLYIMTAAILGTLVMFIIYNRYEHNNRDEASSTFQYTLKRAGYNPLDHFPTKNATFTYKILRDHIGVIEPAAPMKIHSFGNQPVSGVYEVCPASYDKRTEGQSCATGTYENLNGEDISSSFRLNCVQLSTYTVDIRMYSNSGALMYRDNSTAICMTVRREIRSMVTAGM